MTVEILKRVSVKLLVQCKSVCKSWRFIISDPEFIKTHSYYQQSLTDKEISILMIAKSGFDALPPLVSPDFKCYIYEPDHFKVVGSCNGIICLVFELHCYLWNPVTKKCKELPEFPPSDQMNLPEFPPSGMNLPEFPPSQIVPDHQVGNLAFYFDTISNDYKVLRHLCEQTTGESMVLHLYSTNTNSWRDIHVHDTSPTKVMSYPCLKLGPLISGVIYMGRKEYVVSFNLHTEVFTMFPTPSYMVRYSDILDFEGSVAVIFGSKDRGSEISLGILDNSNGNVSWTKKFNIVEDTMGWIYSCLGGGMFYGRKRDSAGFFLYDYRKKNFKYRPLPD
ncbi:putative F-box protein At4g38870 [Apium graveolens]|uniref:putative F-box protein At4g38870 n=1 Tax=Apium graveolens TaxID=4045 RepID=UPI003D797D6D